MSRFYSSRVSRKGNTKTTGGEIGKEKWTEGKGPWLGSPRHWGPGRDGIHRLAVLVYRGSLRSSYYAPFLVPHLARPTLLSFSPCFCCFDDTLPSLSLSHADPLERTRFYLSLSPVNGLCRPAPRFSIVFLSLSLFRFHLLSLYNSVRKEPRVLLGVEEREKGLIVAGKIGQRTTPVSLPCRFSLFLSRVLHLRSSNVALLRATILCSR